MSSTPNLGLPLIAAAQAQKHVTVNEALSMLDAVVQLHVMSRLVSIPPDSPNEGDRYIIPPAATGLWQGHGGQITVFQDGNWNRIAPAEGCLAWVHDENRLLVRDNGVWTEAAPKPGPASLLGINATPDTTNRLAVNAPATLFSHEGADHRLAINKAGQTATASLVFQSGFSGRAEMGLAGTDDWTVKVSPDGMIWTNALVVNRSTGLVSFPNTPGLSGSGETNTSSNSGTGLGLAKAKSGINLPFKSLKPGANIVLTDGPDDITIAASGGGGSTPGGASGTIQYNAAGSLAGATGLTFNAATGQLGVAGSIDLAPTSGAGTGMMSSEGTRFLHSYGTDNLFLGVATGNFTLTGTKNVGFGPYALFSLTSGSDNMAIGYAALDALTSGTGNVGIGSYALSGVTTGNGNVGLGSQALLSLTTGSNCIALGAGAATNATLASYSVFLGGNAGSAVTTGSQNIFIGQSAGGGVATGSRNVVIGGVSGLAAALSDTILIGLGDGTLRLTISAQGHLAAEGAIRPRGYTVATVPAAAVAGAGALIYVSNESGGPVMAFSDGTAWRRVTDRAIVT